MTLLSHFHFKGNQEKAVTDSSSAIAVTAGAGSGKTLSLVGRYLHLLEQGYPIRSILAITFTEKAAREMRSRIRDSLSHVSTDAAQDKNSAFRIQHSSIDFSRIGTIHSLCAELLRAHPAEAGLDPQFEVLEEGLSAALQAEAIESALAWASTDEESVGLFGVFKENELRQILNALMSRRLDVTSASAESALADFHELRQGFIPPNPRDSKIVERFATSLSTYLATHLDSPNWLDSLSVLASVRSSSPEDKLELSRQTVLAKWDEIQQARASKNWNNVLISLGALRKAISTQGQKANWDDITTIREAMGALRDLYEEHLKFLAEKSRFALDEQLAAQLPAVHRLLDQTVLEYQHRKDERQSLDFDDLEGLTAQLLTTHPEVRAQIQVELRAVLVDEFQDTNDRQRQIVYALTGFNPQSSGLKPPPQNMETLRVDAPESASADFHELRQDFSPPNPNPNHNPKSVDLFIVGDSKQSIYRFRSADVTVFRQVQADIRDSGGELIDLDLTFRAHKSLLEQLNSLLAPILGETDDPARPYAVPFAPLHADRPKPVRENIQPPFIEFHLGLGENAEEGRAASAQALANRLHELHENEGFAWGDMALLFRSSTAYDVYENALEAADIPFVTVAGRGFYDRPEIRDLLNILAAIADPTDDLALVGALRSPAFAIPDSEIYKLRYPDGATEPAKIFETLSTQVDTYTGEEVDRYTSTQVNNGTRTTHHALNIHPSSFTLAQCYKCWVIHPFSIITELHALSSRAPAAAILKRLLDLTHYRAILSTDPNGARMIRNVEKLLADAHRSRLVSLTDFLAYVQTLRDVGLREGEAPADPSTGSGQAASNAGAVQLMTVHKAKGLEFPLTVLADAAYQHHAHSALVTWNMEHGTLFDLRDDDFHSTAWQLAARLEDDRAQAEDARLLYVAATRAKEKLLISGHVKQKKDGLSLNGWLSHFSFLENLIPEFPLLENGIYTEIYRYSQTDVPAASQPDSTPQAESPRESDLLDPLVPTPSATEEKLLARESDPPQRVWRIVSKAKTPRAPAWLVGRLVHEALRRWRFDDLENFLKPFALESGLTDEAEIHAAIQESHRLLERLRVHPLFTELDSAERHHEVRYDLPDERGIMDLLYRTPDGWFIIDFKTDEVRSDAEAQSAISQNEYNRQVERYAQAISNQLKVEAKTRLVFLNVNGEVKIYE